MLTRPSGIVHLWSRDINGKDQLVAIKTVDGDGSDVSPHTTASSAEVVEAINGIGKTVGDAVSEAVAPLTAEIKALHETLHPESPDEISWRDVQKTMKEFRNFKSWVMKRVGAVGGALFTASQWDTIIGYFGR